MAVEGLNFDEKVAEVVATKDAISNTDRKKNTQAWNEEATEMGMKKGNYAGDDRPSCHLSLRRISNNNTWRLSEFPTMLAPS